MATDPLAYLLGVFQRMAVNTTAERARTVPEPPPAPVPERKAKPPLQPPPRGIVWDKRVGWHVPCSLSAEELQSTEPSPQLLQELERFATTPSTPAPPPAPRRPVHISPRVWK
jgi:hypothetical protein